MRGMNIYEKVKGKIDEALAKVAPNELCDYTLEFQADNSRGDFSTNIALVVSKKLRKNPKEIAEEIAKLLTKESSLIVRAEIALPGFINIFLTNESVGQIEKEVKEYCVHGAKQPLGKINIEFISVNPTGPLHIGHGRGAFFGDTYANILSFAGADVSREFYINDSKDSNQIKELGKTALGVGEQYKTEALLEKIKMLDVANLSESEAGFTVAELLQKENEDVIKNKLHISFDEFYSEDARLRATGASQKMFERLQGLGFVYEKDGAQWLKTSEFGDLEDRVLVRSDGSVSYFLSDIAYHDEKFSRGLSQVIDVWGAEHEGHVARMKAVAKMLSWKGDFTIYIAQRVTLKEDGVLKKISKRAGTAISLEDLVDELGLDVVRYNYMTRSLGTHMEFDMALARDESEKNPVHYIRYAHARASTLIEKTEGLEKENTKKDMHPSTRLLLLKLASFEHVISRIVGSGEVHRLPQYAYELAQTFSGFYRDIRIIDENKVDESALSVTETTRVVLQKTLNLMGISAPTHM